MRASAECRQAAVVSRGRSHRLCAWNAYTTVNAAYPEVLAFWGMFVARPVRTTAAFAHEQCADLILARLLGCPVCCWNPEILTGLWLPRWLRTRWEYGFQSRSIHRPNSAAKPPQSKGVSWRAVQCFLSRLFSHCRHRLEMLPRPPVAIKMKPMATFVNMHQ